jgi:hypothetical protein
MDLGSSEQTTTFSINNSSIFFYNGSSCFLRREIFTHYIYYYNDLVLVDSKNIHYVWDYIDQSIKNSSCWLYDFLFFDYKYKIILRNNVVLNILLLFKHTTDPSNLVSLLDRFEVVQHHYCRSCLVVVVLLIIILRIIVMCV